MAASTMSRAETFGHYLLPLTMNKGHINAKQAEYHIEVKTRYLDLKKHRPERHALRNLLGMLHFRLDNSDESLAYFDKILSDGEDPENLNALANRKYICEKLYWFTDSRVCEEKISELLPDNTLEEGEESRLRRARSIAEQAFAYSFDVFEESVTTERYRTSVDLYNKAFELAGDSLTPEEREDWMISKGMACHKIFNKVKWDKSLKEEAQTWLEETVNIFVQIVEETVDNSLASESWRQLGEIFQEVKSRYFIRVPGSFKWYLSQPERCFKKALHYMPQDPRILARFAKFLIKIRKKEEALRYVNQSIDEDKTVFNSFAFSVRGKIFLEDYKRQLTACQPNDSFLTKAQEDFEKISEKHSTPMNLEELALVYYYMATDCHGNVKTASVAQTYLKKALSVCARAAACQDGEKRPLVHKIRGQSLCALGEHKQSLRSFQRAIECEKYNRVIFDSGNLLIVEYGHVLKDKVGDLSDQQPFLADMVYWLHKAAKLRLSNSEWTKYTMKPLLDLTSLWQTFVKFCEDNDYITELEDIKEASLEPRQTRSRERRTVPTSDLEARPTLPPMRHSQSVTEEARGAGFGECHPHARMESATASLSALELDDKESSLKAKEETSCLNLLRTCKVQLCDQTSSSQEWTSNDASNKPISSAPEMALNRYLPNDFFVIYSSSASEWVFRCLLEELEGSDRKGCIKDRDFILGETTHNNYANSIINSACVIVVITEDFMQDVWCNYSMLMAIEKGKLLIPVIREDTELPLVLNTLPHHDATGAVDWERLERIIEQHIIKLDDAAQDRRTSSGVAKALSLGCGSQNLPTDITK